MRRDVRIAAAPTAATYNPAVLDNVSAWWRSLEESPAPMRPGEKLAAWLVTIAVAITRWLALAKSPWDWDEALFMLGLRHFSVPSHHPHPPGFPLFIGTAKLLTFIHFDAFHALQHVSFIAAVAIVPSMLLLGRELRLSTRTSLIAGVFLAMSPNVWLFGGTAFSDVPSMTLAILSIAMLLRGCRDDAAFIGGAILLGIAAGYRPQNLTIGFAPAVIASLRGLPRHWVRPIVAALIIAIIVAASYGAAAYLSGGWEIYRDAVRAHQQYITKIDSYHSPTRPPLLHLLDDFFIRPYRMPAINIVFSLLALVSLATALVKLRAPILAILAAFGPFCIAAWLLLDHFSVSRFSIGYAPLFAILAADGLHLLTIRSRRAEAWATALIAIGIAIWMWPVLAEVRRRESPTFAAARWVRHNFDTRRATLYVHDSMQPLAEAFLPDVPFVATGDVTPTATATSRPGDAFLVEGASPEAGVQMFSRPRKRLLQLVRDRYFEVSLIPLTHIITFADGWYDPESTGVNGWRWMGHRGRALLPPIKGRARLVVRLYVPLDAIKGTPNVTISLNGVALDRVAATKADIERTFTVTPRSDVPNELVIETDRVVNPLKEHINGDPRDLGVRVSGIEWGEN